MVVYGVVLIVGTLALWYLAAPSSPAPSPTASVPCTIGALPPTRSSPNASLAARDSAFPSPVNGTFTPEGFTLWINTSDRLLPGVNVSFAVRALPGLPAGGSCDLPIPGGNWISNVTSLTLAPQHDYPVSFVGAPNAAYPREGAFALEAWVNATNVPGSLGSTHTFVSVSPS